MKCVRQLNKIKHQGHKKKKSSCEVLAYYWLTGPRVLVSDLGGQWVSLASGVAISSAKWGKKKYLKMPKDVSIIISMSII